ncbi:ATP-binding protein [Burkholderia ubonensis]|uniref:ATP-binding protein n=1 Tax=Burkholderia ubonensis TaxID=101571 RepID=UPI000AA23E24
MARALRSRRRRPPAPGCRSTSASAWSSIAHSPGRDTRRLERLLKSAKLKNPQACIEDLEYRQSRGVDKSVVAALAGCDWIRNAQNLILTGPTGAGKAWIACASVQQACRQGFSVMYVRVARLFEELKIALRRRQLHAAARTTRQNGRPAARRLGPAGPRSGCPKLLARSDR